MARGAKPPFTKRKAKEILKEKRPTLRGKPITRKQRGLLGAIAGDVPLTRLKKKKKISSHNEGTNKAFQFGSQVHL